MQALKRAYSLAYICKMGTLALYKIMYEDKADVPSLHVIFCYSCDMSNRIIFMVIESMYGHGWMGSKYAEYAVRKRVLSPDEVNWDSTLKGRVAIPMKFNYS